MSILKLYCQRLGTTPSHPSGFTARLTSRPSLVCFNVQPEFAQKGNIDISRGIFCGKKFVAVKNRIRTGKKAERLTFTRQLGAPGCQADARFRQSEAGNGNQP